MVHLLRVTSQSCNFCSFQTTEGTQRKPLPWTGKYLIYVVSKQTASASVPLSEQTWDVRGVQGSPGSRERQETAPWQAHIISGILLSGFPKGLFTEPPGHCCCCCWSPTYFVSCQDPRGCGQQTTSWRGGGVFGSCSAACHGLWLERSASS